MKNNFTRAIAYGIAALTIPALSQAQSYKITTAAGGSPFSSTLGDGGAAASAFLNMPSGLAVDTVGNLYIADTGNHVIRKVTPAGTISTIAGTHSLAGFSGDNGPATSAQLSSPGAVAVDASGNVYIADTQNSRIRKVSASGTITTVAGGGLGSATSVGDGGAATQAELRFPEGITVDASGNLYIADYGNFRVRKVTASTGIITTVAGNGTYTPASIGDGGPAIMASVAPYSVALDSNNNLYIADYLNNRIRLVNAVAQIATVAGGGTAATGPATAISLSHPQSVTVDGSGNIYIADTGNQVVRLAAANGTIKTIAGTGQIGSTGDGGYGAGATLNNPAGVALGSGGTIYIADNANTETAFGAASVGDYRIRLLTPGTAELPATITASGIVPVYSSATTIQPGSWISIFGTNFAGATTTWSGNFPTSLGGVSVTINSKPAYLWYVSPTQINLQAPTDTATGTVPVVVTTPAGSVSSTATLGLFGPSFNLLDTKHAIGIVLTPGLPGNSGAGYDLIGPASPTTRPVKAGETLVLFGVGFGPTNPAVPAGQIYSGSAPTAAIPAVTIGGMSAAVTYSGIVQAGLYQLNVVVPSAGTGDQILLATIGGVTTPANVFITLQ
jgi:uncharacterized protein (TIGR03437 family)